MEKNVAGKWVVFAYGLPDHANPGQPVTGDAANITANVRIDGGAANAVDDTNPTELEDGYYIFDLTATETNGDLLTICPASATANVQVIGVPGSIYTRPANFNALGVGADGDLLEVNTLTGHTAQTGDSYARLGAPAGASVSADIAAIDGDTTNILADTAELQTDWTNGGRLDLIIDAILADTAQIGTATDTDIATDLVNISTQIGSISGGAGGSVNIEATEDNTGGAIDPSLAAFVGSVQGATTYANTEAVDGVYHDIDASGASDIDIVYGFSVGGGRKGTSVTFTGFVQGSADEMKIKAYDHVGADWEIIGTITGTNGTNNSVIDCPLLLKHTGTSGAEVGKVYIRLEKDSTTPSNLSVDGLIVSAVDTGQTVGYALGAIWVDEAGTAASEDFVNGTADNPCPWANAKTISASLGITRFIIVNGSTVTLDANVTNYVFIGAAGNVALGGQTIDGATFENLNVSGTGVATVNAPHFNLCEFTAGATLGPSDFYQCGFLSSAIVVGSPGNFDFIDCYSLVAGAGSPTIDMGAAIGATNMSIRRWGGGLTLSNLAAGDVVSAECLAGGTLTLNGADATVNIRGGWANVTNNLTGSPTVTDRSTNKLLDTIDAVVDDVLYDTSITLDNYLTDIQGATFNTVTDSLKAIRDRGDAAWTTGAGGSDRLLMVDTTIATLASQTSFTLTAGSADDDAYNNCTIIIEDVATSTQKAVGMVLDYVGSTKTVTLKEALAFTIATTDKVYILAENSLKSTVANRQLDVTATGAAGIDWGNVENPTTAVDLSATDIQLCDTVTTNSDMRGTDSAALASVCTEARLAELDAANLPSDISALQTTASGIQTDLDNATDGLGALKTLIDAIQTDLSNGTDGLGALKTLIDTVDTVVDAIKAKTDSLTFTTANQVDANMLAISSDTVAADNLEESATAILSTTVSSSAGATSCVLAAGSTRDDTYIGRTLIVVSGTNAGEATDITDYVGSTKTLTYTALTSALTTSDQVVIV